MFARPRSKARRPSLRASRPVPVVSLRALYPVRRRAGRDEPRWGIARRYPMVLCRHWFGAHLGPSSDEGAAVVLGSDNNASCVQRCSHASRGGSGRRSFLGHHAPCVSYVGAAHAPGACRCNHRRNYRLAFPGGSWLSPTLAAMVDVADPFASRSRSGLHVANRLRVRRKNISCDPREGGRCAEKGRSVGVKRTRDTPLEPKRTNTLRRALG